MDVNKNIDLPEIAIGTWALGGDYWGEQQHSDSVKTIHAAIRNNINFFDTAPVYGKGKSEQLLGQQLKPREEQIIITKCFIKPLESVKKSLEQSLKRLNTDYIDYFLIHWPSTELDAKPMIELLEKYRAKGVIKKIGVSNFNRSELIDVMSVGQIDLVQNAYNFFWNRDAKYFKFCKNNNIKTQAYSTLAQGLLTGKFNINKTYTSKDLRHKMLLFNDENLPTVYKYIDELIIIAVDLGISLHNLMLKWTMSLNYIDSIVVGCRNRTQVEELIKVKECKLSPEIITKLTLLSTDVSNKIIGEKNIFNHYY